MSKNALGLVCLTQKAQACAAFVHRACIEYIRAWPTQGCCDSRWPEGPALHMHSAQMEKGSWHGAMIRKSKEQLAAVKV